jgi:CDGSH-type Zn-finger protein
VRNADEHPEESAHPESSAHPARPAHEPAPRRVTVERNGPVVVEGPVEVVTEDGTRAVSRRFAVAVCTCRRSAAYPWCDTSHRARERRRREHGGGEGDTA